MQVRSCTLALVGPYGSKYSSGTPSSLATSVMGNGLAACAISISAGTGVLMSNLSGAAAAVDVAILDVPARINCLWVYTQNAEANALSGGPPVVGNWQDPARTFKLCIMHTRFIFLQRFWNAILNNEPHNEGG